MSFLQEIDQALGNLTLFGIFFFILGACIASFFNVVVLRYPKMVDSENATDIKNWLEEKNIKEPDGLSQFIEKFDLSYPSSHCYSCKNPLKWYHNIPILSYLFLRGKCGFCSVKISIQYPIVELLGGLILLMSYLVFFPKYGTLGFVLAGLFFTITYLLLLIDIKTMFLPDSLNYFLMWVGILSASLNFKIMNISLTDSIWGAFIGYMILWIFSTIGSKLKGMEVMGGGDLKLVAALGAFTGIGGAIFTIFASPFIGIFSWIYIKLSKKENPQFPYGPALIISNWIYIFYGKEILRFLGIII